MRRVCSLAFLGVFFVFAHHNTICAQNDIPYSANFKTTTVRTLANGTTITHESTGRVARDSTGRTYHEETHEVDGGDHKFNYTFITIFDPTASELILLEPHNKEAGINHIGAHPPPGTPRPSLSSGATAERPLVEKLGTKDIDGVTVEGTRTTKTIPAGANGNDQPMVIVTERWFSPQLRMDLERKVDDPRVGITKTEYSDILRGEPDPALFRIPDGYTVREEKHVQATP